jgi:hypothetical protein
MYTDCKYTYFFKNNALKHYFFAIFARIIELMEKKNTQL